MTDPYKEMLWNEFQSAWTFSLAFRAATVVIQGQTTNVLVVLGVAGALVGILHSVRTLLLEKEKQLTQVQRDFLAWPLEAVVFILQLFSSILVKIMSTTLSDYSYNAFTRDDLVGTFLVTFAVTLFVWLGGKLTRLI